MEPESSGIGKLTPVIVFGVFSLAAVFVWRAPLSVALVAAGFLLAAGLKLWDNKSRQKKAKKSSDQIKANAKAAKDEVLKKLEAVTDVADELTVNIRSIHKIGRYLVSYDSQGSQVVAEILNAYSGFIQDYLDGAASFAVKYRRAQKYIKSKDPAQLRLEVKQLEKRMANGETALEKTYKEKLATLNRLEEMMADQRTMREGMAKIQATLEGLEASIIAAENEPDREREIMDELQVTLSSTARAIEKTLIVAAKKD